MKDGSMRSWTLKSETVKAQSNGIEERFKKASFLNEIPVGKMTGMEITYWQ